MTTHSHLQKILQPTLSHIPTPPSAPLTPLTSTTLLTALTQLGIGNLVAPADAGRQVVTGLIPGSHDPQSEVWILAAPPPSLQPESLSAALLLQIAATLCNPTVPRPRRSIRFLAPFETGAVSQFYESQRRFQPPLAGLCIDVSARQLPTPTWHATAPGSANFVDYIGAALLQNLTGGNFALRPFTPTSETLLADPLNGFPCPLLHGTAGQSTALITAAAAYAHFVANAGTPETLQLADAETRNALSELATSSPSRATAIQLQHAASLTRLERFLWTGNHRDLATQFATLRRQVQEASPQPSASSLPAAAQRIVLRKRPLPAAERSAEWRHFLADSNRSIAEIHILLQQLDNVPRADRSIDLASLTALFEQLESRGEIQLLDPASLITEAQLLANLRALGLRPGMDVMVHSSLSKIGPVRGGAPTVVCALLAAIAPGGTLLAPSFNHFNAKLFNPLTTPTTNGAIPDALWRRPDSVRSTQASHSVAAIGPRAEFYTRDHLTHGIWAAESPIGRLIKNGGYILSLGVTNATSTAYHVAEISMPAPCLDQFSSTDLILIDGEVCTAPGLAWRNGTCPVSPDLLDAALDAANLRSHGNVGRAPSTLVKAEHIYRLRREHLHGICPTCPVRPTPRTRRTQEHP